ncbi:hypothetical protein AAZX31_18G167800 [Glycine max]
MTVSLSDFLQPQKILLWKSTSWDLSLDKHVEGRLLQPEGTSLPLMSPRHDRTYQPFGSSSSSFKFFVWIKKNCSCSASKWHTKPMADHRAQWSAICCRSMVSIPLKII